MIRLSSAKLVRRGTRGPPSTWTDEQLAILFDMIGDGYSFGQVAKRLGRPRGTVIGKFHRMLDQMGVQAG